MIQSDGTHSAKSTTRNWMETEAVSHLLRLARKGKVTLLYSARNTEHNEAAALRDYLLQQFAS